MQAIIYGIDIIDVWNTTFKMDDLNGFFNYKYKS
jgi:hypothetical protein